MDQLSSVFNTSSVRECSNIPNVNPSLPIEDFCPTVFSFHTDPPSFYQEEAIFLDFLWTNANFSDSEGQLLLYSNGMSIHGRNHIPIIGGDTISFGPAWDSRTWTNEFGETEALGYDMTYGAVFIPRPGHDNRYYFINTDYNKNFQSSFYGYVEKPVSYTHLTLPTILLV